MKYIRLFDNHTEYENYISGETAELPNVSYCNEEMDVHYNPWVEPPFFLRIIRTNGSVVDVEGSGAITSSHVSNKATIAEVQIGELCTSISLQAFTDCKNMTSLTISRTVVFIGDMAFWGCNGLSSIVVDSENTFYDSRDNCNGVVYTSTNTLVLGCKRTIIPNSITTIGKYAFGGCATLSRIRIPDSVTVIDDHAFNQCNGLTSVTIGSNVTHIGSQAFYSCSTLTTIVLPSSVIRINGRAFHDCKNLVNITSLATTAPQIVNTTFRNVKTNGTLTVPIGSSGYDVWMGTSSYYLGSYNWTKVEQ